MQKLQWLHPGVHDRFDTAVKRLVCWHALNYHMQDSLMFVTGMPVCSCVALYLCYIELNTLTL